MVYKHITIYVALTVIMSSTKKSRITFKEKEIDHEY
jgi:hypothetical protein